MLIETKLDEDWQRQDAAASSQQVESETTPAGRLNEPRKPLAMMTSSDNSSAGVDSKIPGTVFDPKRTESQFTIRHVFACFFIVAVCLAPLQAGFAAMMFISAPGVILGVDLVLRGRLWRSQSKTTVGKWLLSGSIAIGVILGLCACLKNGMPATTATWCLLIGCVLWCVVLATKLEPRVTLFAVLIPLTLQFHLVAKILPIEQRQFVDLRRMREDYSPFRNVMFVQPSHSTKIIASYLGPAESHWVSTSQLGILKYSILAHDDLEKYLAVLPSDDARRQVLSALTDHENLLRHHQELLLIAIRAIGYPRGEDPAAWWEKYSYVFRSYHDAAQAVAVARGWRKAIEKRLLGRLEKGDLKDPTAQIWGMPFNIVHRVEFGRTEFAEAAEADPLWDKPLDPKDRIIYWPYFGSSVPRQAKDAAVQ
jgi:hypothetical protein